MIAGSTRESGQRGAAGSLPIRPRSCPPPHQPHVVHVYTIGLNCLDAYDDEDLAAKFPQHFKVPKLVSRYWDAFKTDQKKPNVPGILKHIGENTEFIKVAMQSTCMWKFLADAKHHLKAFFVAHDSSQVANEVSWCAQGRHRSVSWARVYIEMLRMAGYVTRGPTHVGQPWWWSAVCDSCSSCSPNGEKDKLFADAFERWCTL